jgi:DNA-binding phage protein
MVADYLDSNEMIAEYLNTVLEEGDHSEIITAIGNIANPSKNTEERN